MGKLCPASSTTSTFRPKMTQKGGKEVFSISMKSIIIFRRRLHVFEGSQKQRAGVFFVQPLNVEPDLIVFLEIFDSQLARLRGTPRSNRAPLRGTPGGLLKRGACGIAFGCGTELARTSSSLSTRPSRCCVRGNSLVCGLASTRFLARTSVRLG